MINEHDVVALTNDLPAQGLRRGDVGAVVDVHKGGEAFDVEFVDEQGRSRALVTVSAALVMKLNLLKLSA